MNQLLLFVISISIKKSRIEIQTQLLPVGSLATQASKQYRLENTEVLPDVLHFFDAMIIIVILNEIFRGSNVVCPFEDPASRAISRNVMKSNCQNYSYVSRVIRLISHH